MREHGIDSCYPAFSIPTSHSQPCDSGSWPSNESTCSIHAEPDVTSLVSRLPPLGSSHHQEMGASPRFREGQCEPCEAQGPRGSEIRALYVDDRGPDAVSPTARPHHPTFPSAAKGRRWIDAFQKFGFVPLSQSQQPRIPPRATLHT